MTVSLDTLRFRPYEVTPAKCDSCERVVATLRFWLPDDDTIPIPHPMYHNLCGKCLGTVDDLFWEKINARNGFMEPIPPRTIAFMGRVKSEADVVHLLAVCGVKEVAYRNIP